MTSRRSALGRPSADGPWWIWPILLTVIVVLVLGVMTYYGGKPSGPPACTPTSGWPCTDAQEGGGVILVNPWGKAIANPSIAATTR